MKLSRISTYLLVGKFAALSYTHYPLDLMMGIINRALMIASVILFWSVTALASNIDLEIQQLLIYYLAVNGIGELVHGVGFPLGSYLVKEARYGNLSAKLLLPMDVTAFYRSFIMGDKVAYLFIGILSTIAALILSPITFTVTNILLLLLMMVFAFFINYGLSLLVGSFGLYMVDASGAKNTASHILRFFNGFLIPLTLMPELLEQIILYSPLAGTLYVPVAFVAGIDLNPSVIFVAGVWAVVVPTLCLAWWRYSLRKYEAVGL